MCSDQFKTIYILNVIRWAMLQVPLHQIRQPTPLHRILHLTQSIITLHWVSTHLLSCIFPLNFIVFNYSHFYRSDHNCTRHLVLLFKTQTEKRKIQTIGGQEQIVKSPSFFSVRYYAQQSIFK